MCHWRVSTTPEIQMPFPLHFPFGGTLSTVWSPSWPPPNIDCQEHGNSTNQKEGTNCKNQKRLLNVKYTAGGDLHHRFDYVEQQRQQTSAAKLYSGKRFRPEETTIHTHFTYTHSLFSTKGRQLISCVRTSTDTSTIATTAAAGRQLD